MKPLFSISQKRTRTEMARVKYLAARRDYIRTLFADGMSIVDISKKLGLAESTVNNSLSSFGRA